ncbi:MAG: Tic22 family protein [Leptolyngbya sp.]|nr:Tic22 family protein [Leptolyngbya sp.]
MGKSLSLAGAVAGGVALGLFGIAQQALALTAEQIASKLTQIPVFMILDEQGEHLKAVSESDPTVQAPVVFLDGPTAAAVLSQVEAGGQDAQIEIIDLASVYRSLADSNGEAPLLYFPIRDEVAAAVEIEPQFQGVPLFVPRRANSNAYLPFVQGDEISLPMFFSREDLQTYVDWVFEDNPAGAEEIEVEVMSLEWLLTAMAASEDTTENNQFNQVRLFPSSEVLDFIETVRQQRPQSPQ